MRLAQLIAILCLSALCFAGGYIVGNLNREPDPAGTETLSTEKTTVSKELIDEDSKVAVSDPEPEVEESAPSEAPLEPTVSAEEKMAERAQQSLITLTDSRGRQITVELLETGEGFFKVRRQSDSRVVEVPFNMLSERDQEFALYLQKQPVDERPLSDEEILRRIFGD